jgi:hypothetical protein
VVGFAAGVVGPTATGPGGIWRELARAPCSFRWDMPLTWGLPRQVGRDGVQQHARRRFTPVVKGVWDRAPPAVPGTFPFLGFASGRRQTDVVRETPSRLRRKRNKLLKTALSAPGAQIVRRDPPTNVIWCQILRGSRRSCPPLPTILPQTYPQGASGLSTGRLSDLGEISQNSGENSLLMPAWGQGKSHILICQFAL